MTDLTVRDLRLTMQLYSLALILILNYNGILILMHYRGNEAYAVYKIMSYGILLWGSAADIETIFILQKRAIRAIYEMRPRESLSFLGGEGGGGCNS